MTVFPIEPKHMVSYSKRTNSFIQEKFCKKNAFQCFIMQFKLQINQELRAICSLKKFFHTTVLPIGGMEKTGISPRVT